MLQRTLSFLFFFALVSLVVQGQERSTQSSEVQSFFLNPDLEGAGQSSVNLYSGDVNLPINLLSISGRGGLNTSVSPFYNSNIQHQRDTWALEAPTSILGLGWSMDYDKIVRDHKNTGNVHDDDYYLVSGGSSNELIMISSSGGIKTFKPKNYQPWKITYDSGDERWEVIKEDGTTYVFGGGISGTDGTYSSDGSSVQWGVKWGNWIGSSIITSGQQQFAIAWNLSAVRNTWGDELTYSYLAVEEEVGRPTSGHASVGKRHTKASYLSTITTPEGSEVEFFYNQKSSYEYTDPHQGAVDIPNLTVFISGSTCVDAGGDGSWDANVGNAIGTLSYQWAYRFDEGGAWINAGTNSDSFTLTNIIPNPDDYDFQVRVTIDDSQGEQDVESNYVSVSVLSEGCGPVIPTPSYSGGAIAMLEVDGDEEPDAYQEKYEDKYLSRISVTNTEDADLYFIDFVYDFYGTEGDPDYKRILTNIYHTYPNGETLPDLKFDYYDSGDHLAALEKVTYPTGTEVTYTYSELTIDHSNQSLTVDRPSTDYEDPRVWIESDYVVVTWNQVDDADADDDDDVWLKVYTWEGKWVEYDHGIIADRGDYIDIGEGGTIDIRQNFEIFLSGDAFLFIDDFYEKTTLRGFRLFHKDEKIPGEWGYDYRNVSTSNTFLDVVAGDDFFAIAEMLEDDIRTFQWNGSAWSNQYTLPYTGNDASGNDTFIGGSGNFLIIDNEGEAGEDIVLAFYLDELKQWTAGTANTNLSFESSVTNSDWDARNYVRTGQSIFTLSLNGDDEGIFKINEDYSISNGFNVGNTNSHHNPVYSNSDELFFFGKTGEGNSGIGYRYNGYSYIGLSSSFTLNTFTYSIGNDLIVKRGYESGQSQEYGVHVHFDPNSNSWDPLEYISDNPPGSAFKYLYTDTFANLYVYGRKGFYKNIEGGVTEFGDLSAGTDNAMDYLSMRVGNNYIAYNTQYCNSGNCDNLTNTHQLRIAKIKNGQILEYEDLGTGNSIRSTGYQPSRLVALNTIVSSNQPNLSDATQLTLFRKVGDEFEGTQTDYPVTQIEVDNGYGSSLTNIDYTLYTATADLSGTMAQYNKVTTELYGASESPGDHGSTEYFFFNGLEESDASESFPSSGHTNAEDYLKQVKGLVYKVKMLDASDGLISETINHWNAFEEPIYRNNDDQDQQLGISYYTRQQYTETTTDDVYNYTQMWYNQGRLEGSLFPNYLFRSGSGSLDKDYIVTSYTYPSDSDYSELVDLNIINQPIYSYTYIIDELGDVIFDYTEASATIWKDWGGGKWAPHSSHVWKGSGSHSFDHVNWTEPDDPPSANWIKTSEIISRNTYGAPTEVEDADGIPSSTVYGFDGSRGLASFGNAQRSEVRFDGFDDISSPADSDLDWWVFDGGDWTIVDGALHGYKASGSEGYLQALSGVNHANAILEFDVKFEDGGSNDWMGFQFRLIGDEEDITDDGNYLKITQSGALSINRLGSTLGSGSIEGSMGYWRHVRLISSSNGDMQVYVDGELIASANNVYGVNSEHYGFIVNGATVLIDNLRIYPKDAVASSTGYDPVYVNTISTSDANGYLTQLIRDDNQRVREIQNAQGMVMSASTSVLSRQLSGSTFSTVYPNASYQASFPSYNAIRNGGGEYGDDILPHPWHSVSTDGVQRDSSRINSYSGIHSLKFDPDNTSDEMMQYLPENTFLWQGKTYFLRFWVKMTGSPGGSPTVTASLKKEDGSGVTSTVFTTNTITLNNNDWHLFEAEINTDGGQYYGWNYEDYRSKIVITVNRIDFNALYIDDMYLGELEYAGGQRPGYAISFSDGAGKAIQSQVWNGTDYTVSHSEYDELGRPWKTWRTYEHATEGKYDPDFATNVAANYSGEVHYSKREYYTDPLSRLYYVYPDGDNTDKITYSYGGDDPYGVGDDFSYTQVTGLDGVISRIYSDYQGRSLRSIQDYGTGTGYENITSETLYDPITITSENRPPNYFDPPTGSASDWVATSSSDFMGTLMTSTSPDAGTGQVKNDEQGRLRFSQSAQQAVNELVSYTSYDGLGRPVVSGEATDDDFTGLDGEFTESFESDDLTAISVNAYDSKPSSGTFPWSLFSSQTGDIDLDNALQGVAAEAYKTNGKSAEWLDLDGTTVTSNSGSSVSSGGEIILGDGYIVEAYATQLVESSNQIILEPGFHAETNSFFSARIVEGLDGGDANDEEWQAIYYSYNFEGRLAKKWILTQDKPELRTELSYQYNDAGQVTRQHTKIGTNQELYHFYTYDIFGRIKDVYVDDSSTRPSTPIVTYTYDAEGKIISKETPQSSLGVAYYSYDEQGRLEVIDSDYSVFRQDIAYNTDGTISSISSQNDLQLNINYSYDALNRLTASDVVQGTNKYDVTNIAYDKNGNLESLNRYSDPDIIDQLTYGYKTGTNKLSTVTDAVSSTGEDWDAEDASYTFSIDGNMISSTKDGGGGFDGISYGTNNLPVSMITDDGLEQVYRYNSAGWRISKESIDRSTGNTLSQEHYIMDGGTNLAVTDSAGNVLYWNLYGNELIGRQEANGDRKYYVYDHLGSVRFVYDDNYSIIAQYDYYPFGLVMESYLSEETKEGFTGKERDDETGLHYFGARYYDAALGRWSVTDPAGQYATPYGYPTDPMMYTDPNGEFAFLIPIAIGAAIGAATSTAVYTAVYYASGMGGSGEYWKGAGKAAAMGAVSGAISGGLGSAFATSAFGQTTAFNILNSSVSNIGTNLAFGNEITMGSIAGSAVGGVVSSTIPSYKGVKGGGLKNVAAELSYSAGVGALSGVYSGVTKAVIDNDDSFNFAESAAYGALGGATVSALKITAFGPSTIPDDVDFVKAREQLDADMAKVGYEIDRYSQPVFRRGGLWAGLGGTPVSLGRNLLVHGEGNFGTKADILFEEYYHYYQAIHKGYANFLTRGIYEQLRFRLGGVDPYYTPGNLEYGAALVRCAYGTAPSYVCNSL